MTPGSGNSPLTVRRVKLQAAAAALRIPEAVELRGLDYAVHHAYEDAKRTITEANLAHLARN